MSRNLEINVPTGFSNVLNNQIQQATQAAISSTLMATKSKWEQVAQQKLNTTRADYILGLNADNSLEFPDAMTGILTLRGKWPNMLEEGFTSFDIKDGFAASMKKKMKKDGGWYLTVPFRHRTPNSTGSAVGGKAMPTDIYSQARALQGNTGRLTGTEQQYPAQTSWNGYQHKSGIYEGIQKNTKQYDKTSQNTYASFRRVSDKSDPQSWWHPGFAGIKAVDTVYPFAQQTFERVLQDYIKQTMG
ncbi:hypothetical protein [Bacillus paranthracis]|uniref:hypothetical protein n=1 Tax=Bacillus paranthracis TaxID=2026186 RepID=UPI0021FCC6C6|nr:hypothetical protein [Bacillus paranthracis]UXR28856.1 hypothetical protein [Bacillus phage Nachito]